MSTYDTLMATVMADATKKDNDQLADLLHRINGGVKEVVDGPLPHSIKVGYLTQVASVMDAGRLGMASTDGVNQVASGQGLVALNAGASGLVPATGFTPEQEEFLRRFQQIVDSMAGSATFTQVANKVLGWFHALRTTGGDTTLRLIGMDLMASGAVDQLPNGGIDYTQATEPLQTQITEMQDENDPHSLAGKLKKARQDLADEKDDNVVDSLAYRLAEAEGLNAPLQQQVTQLWAAWQGSQAAYRGILPLADEALKDLVEIRSIVDSDRGLKAKIKGSRLADRIKQAFGAN